MDDKYIVSYATDGHEYFDRLVEREFTAADEHSAIDVAPGRVVRIETRLGTPVSDWL